MLLLSPSGTLNYQKQHLGSFRWDTSEANPCVKVDVAIFTMCKRWTPIGCGFLLLEVGDNVCHKVHVVEQSGYSKSRKNRAGWRFGSVQYLLMRKRGTPVSTIKWERETHLWWELATVWHWPADVKFWAGNLDGDFSSWTSHHQTKLRGEIVQLIPKCFQPSFKLSDRAL